MTTFDNDELEDKNLEDIAEEEDIETPQGEEEDDQDQGQDDGGDEFQMPEKFKGKSPEDIAKSYQELEKMIEKKASERARQLEDAKRPKEEVKDKDDVPEWIKTAMKDIDFSKMKPDEFVKYLLTRVETRAQDIARGVYDQADTTKAEVQKDINSLSKSWPLQTNEKFRSLVLTFIENAGMKGEIMPLKEACKKAGEVLDIKIGSVMQDKKVEEDKPKPKLGVERSAGAGGGDDKSDEDKVIDGLLKGSTKGNSLGGLY